MTKTIDELKAKKNNFRLDENKAGGWGGGGKKGEGGAGGGGWGGGGGYDQLGCVIGRKEILYMSSLVFV